MFFNPRGSTKKPSLLGDLPSNAKDFGFRKFFAIAKEPDHTKVVMGIWKNQQMKLFGFLFIETNVWC